VVRDGDVVLLEDILERIVGDENVSSRSFLFHKYVYRLEPLRIHTEVKDGETVITDEAAFIDALKHMDAEGRISAPSLRKGIKCL
jgi:hypothetical protein